MKRELNIRKYLFANLAYRSGFGHGDESCMQSFDKEASGIHDSKFQLIMKRELNTRKHLFANLVHGSGF